MIVGAGADDGAGIGAGAGDGAGIGAGGASAQEIGTSNNMISITAIISLFITAPPLIVLTSLYYNDGGMKRLEES